MQQEMNTDPTSLQKFAGYPRISGNFVISIDYGRPKLRELVLSREQISMTRKKAGSTTVNFDLCLRKEVVLVAFHPNGESKIPDVVGSITFFWTTGSGRFLNVKAAKIDFTDVEEMKLWAGFITYLSKCNEVTTHSFCTSVM